MQGEYWLEENGQSTFADGDVGDANHEMVAFWAGIQLNDEEAPEGVSPNGIDLTALGEGLLEELGVRDGIVEVGKWPKGQWNEFLKKNDLNPFNRNEGGYSWSREEVLGLNKLVALGANMDFVWWWFERPTPDSRDFALEQMDWIRVKGNNFQVNDFDDRALKNIRNSDFWEQEVEDPEKLELSDDPVWIEEKSTGRFFSVPLRVLFDTDRHAAQIIRYGEGAEPGGKEHLASNPPMPDEDGSKSKGPEYVRLCDLYGDDVPDEHELLWQFVCPGEYEDTLFKIIEVDPVRLFHLKGGDGDSLKSEFENNAEPWQEKLVKGYRKDIKSGKDIGLLVVSSGIVVDGHHRVVALALEGVRSAKAVDLEEPAPSTSGNPPWSERAVKASWGDIEAALVANGIPASWMPKGDLSELGCGHYGCVYRTGDPKVVFKVTTDISEAIFVANYLRLKDAGILSLGVVKYYAIFALPFKHRKRDMFVLWREEVPHVNCQSVKTELSIRKWAKKSDDRVSIADDWQGSYEQRTFRDFENLLIKFKEKAHVAKIVADRKRQSCDDDTYWAWMADQLAHGQRTNDLSDAQVALIEAGKFKYPYKFALLVQQCWYISQELGSEYYGVNIGQALEKYLDAGLLLADVHCGNIGLSDDESDEDRQTHAPIITDPGHAVVLKRELEAPTILALTGRPADA